MRREDFNFTLPEELIAQDPLEDRSSSRLLVLDKETGETEHHVFREIINYLEPGDCLVINDTKVIPARLIGAKIGTDAKIEILLLKRKENDVWETLVKPGKKAKIGTRISFGDGLLIGEVVDIVEEGNRLIHFEYEGIFEEFWTGLVRCRFRRISRINWKIKIVTRLCMLSTADLQRLRQRGCTSRRNFWMPFRRKGCRSPE